MMALLKETKQADLNNYDKLMRYQTTMNNQLSIHIGELLELEKRYAT
jgi:autotransporter adhesin